MSAHTLIDLRSPAGRGGVFMLILLAHLALLWALTRDVAQSRLHQTPTLVSVLIHQRTAPQPEPLRPIPRIAPRAPESAALRIPAPLVNIERPAESSTAAEGEIGKGSAAEMGAGVVHSRRDALLVYTPETAGFYPLASLEYHEQGDVVVTVCLDTHDQITRAEVRRPSRYSRLDAAALRVAYKTRWRGAMLDDKPVAKCVPMIVTFTDRSAAAG